MGMTRSGIAKDLALYLSCIGHREGISDRRKSLQSLPPTPAQWTRARGVMNSLVDDHGEFVVSLAPLEGGCSVMGGEKPRFDSALRAALISNSLASKRAGELVASAGSTRNG